MRSLLHDYLTTDGNLLYKSGADRVAEANVFHRAPRDKNKVIWHTYLVVQLLNF